MTITAPAVTAKLKLQLIAVLKAQIEKLPFWAFFDSCDQFAHISMSSARILLKPS